MWISVLVPKFRGLLGTFFGGFPPTSKSALPYCIYRCLQTCELTVTMMLWLVSLQETMYLSHLHVVSHMVTKMGLRRFAWQPLRSHRLILQYVQSPAPFLPGRGRLC